MAATARCWVFAEFERATLIDRVINDMERKAARGEWSGARPYDYELAPNTSTLVVREAEAAVPPIIFDLYTRKRLGAKEVANQLNQRGRRNHARQVLDSGTRC